MIAMIQIIITTSFALLFGGYRAIIFAAVFRGPTGLAYDFAGCGPDLYYFAAFAAPVFLRGLVCAPSVHAVLSAIATVAPDNAFIHVLLPFSRLSPGGAACQLLSLYYH